MRPLYRKYPGEKNTNLQNPLGSPPQLKNYLHRTVIPIMLEFDPQKNLINKAKHGGA
jgi:hypothetical protein